MPSRPAADNTAICKNSFVFAILSLHVGHSRRRPAAPRSEGSSRLPDYPTGWYSAGRSGGRRSGSTSGGRGWWRTAGRRGGGRPRRPVLERGIRPGERHRLRRRDPLPPAQVGVRSGPATLRCADHRIIPARDVGRSTSPPPSATCRSSAAVANRRPPSPQPPERRRRVWPKTVGFSTARRAADGAIRPRRW